MNQIKETPQARYRRLHSDRIAESRKTYKASLKAKGLCSTCGRNPISTDSKSSCKKCLSRHNARAKENVARGMCHSHPSVSIAPGSKTRCAECISYDADQRQKKHLAELIRRAKIRAKRDGKIFDLDKHIDELIKRFEPRICELSGLPFSILGNGRSALSPSIDRINPNLGYEYSNVRIICWALNTAFGNWGEEEFLRIIDAWRARK